MQSELRSCTNHRPSPRWGQTPLAVRMLFCAVATLALAPLSVAAQDAPDFAWMRGGHSNGVVRQVYSPDGTLFATCGGDDAKIWRSSDGQLQRTLVADLLPFPSSNSVRGVAFSPDGQVLATASWDSEVRLWNVADGTLIRTITDSGNFLNAVAISPDGQFVCAAGGSVGTIRMWSIATGALVRSFTGHTDWVNDLAFSPDGQRLASASSDDRIRVWNTGTGSQVWSAVAHDFSVVSVDYSPDGLVLGSAGGVSQPRVKTWDAATGTPIRTYLGQTHQSNDVQFSPDGLRIAGSGGDGQVRIWNTASGVLQLSLPVSAPPDVVSSIDFSPDGTQLIAGDTARRLTIWNPVTGLLVREASAHPGWVHGLDFAPDGASLASSGFVIPLLCPVKVYDVATGEQTADLGDVPWGLSDLRYSASGRYLAGASGSGVTYLLDLTDETPDWTIPVAAPPDFPWFARFSPDDTHLVTGGTEGTIQLWTVANPPQLVDFIDFGTTSARNAEFTPDGTKVVIAVGNGIVIWDIGTGDETIFSFPETQNVSDIKVSPDGLTLFASHGMGLDDVFWIRQLDLETLTEIRTFVGHTDAIHSIDLSSDGQFLVSGGADYTVRLWSVADAALLQTYDQECGYYTNTGAEGVPRVVFSPDDQLFAYGRNDGTIAVAQNPYAPTTEVPGDLAGETRVRLRLEPNEPNPIQTGTTISFELPGTGRSSLSVFDLSGRLVRTLVDREMAAGHHRIEWDGRDNGGFQVANGIYWARLRADGEQAHTRMVVVR